MKPFNYFISAFCLGLAAFPLIQAGPLLIRAAPSTPTRPFLASAYQSPYLIGQGITGLNLTAHGGNLYLSPNPKVQKAVLLTAGDGTAYLDSKTPQPIYIDTYDGHLGYASPAPDGAVFVDFLHLGHGSLVYTQGPGYTAQAPGIFQWIGSLDNNQWFACPAQNGEYLVYKVMTDILPPDLSKCQNCDLSALDYTGTSPAVDSYA